MGSRDRKKSDLVRGGKDHAGSQLKQKNDADDLLVHIYFFTLLKSVKKFTNLFTSKNV